MEISLTSNSGSSFPLSLLAPSISSWPEQKMKERKERSREREGEFGNGGKLVNKVDAGFQVLNCKGV